MKKMGRISTELSYDCVERNNSFIQECNLVILSLRKILFLSYCCVCRVHVMCISQLSYFGPKIKEMAYFSQLS